MQAPQKVRGRCVSFVYDRKLRARAAQIRNCCFPARAEAKTNFNHISRSAEATQKRFPLQNLSRKEPCIPRKPSRKGFDIFRFGREKKEKGTPSSFSGNRPRLDSSHSQHCFDSISLAEFLDSSYFLGRHFWW